MMDVIEEIIKFRKDLDDAKKEIKGISGKNKKSAPASNAFQFILKLPVSAVMPNCTDAPDSSGDGAANVSIPAGFNEVAQSLPVLYDLKSPESSQMENV